MKDSVLSERISYLVKLSENLLKTERYSDISCQSWVDSGKNTGLRTASLSFISATYGKNHPYYAEFDRATKSSDLTNAEQGHAILLAIKHEIEKGWLLTIKQLVSAEIFSDFLEMSEHLLSQGYKDPAAVMIGSVLEENLRQLCTQNQIDIEIEKDDKYIAKKADRLNSDLAKAEVYTKLDQKAVTAWLDLRNKAAHGKYDEYTKAQVTLMQQGVTDFLARVNS